MSVIFALHVLRKLIIGIDFLSLLVSQLTNIKNAKMFFSRFV